MSRTIQLILAAKERKKAAEKNLGSLPKPPQGGGSVHSLGREPVEYNAPPSFQPPQGGGTYDKRGLTQ